MELVPSRRGWLANEAGQRRYVVSAGDGKAGTQVFPEADTLLGAGLHQPEKGVATVPANIASRSTGDLPLGDLAADVVFRSICVQGNVGSLGHPHDPAPL